ncbi:hypothetical protein QNO07_19050 [Streptomyces sp. 549]|uniref:DUF7848 domain-containing protein n=1 Tax=Streptomyces sp. 549 TaxID=3049076 RepID=UPI0024C3A364|nr:hypothetical protein [Streptomyces sp. 549]MDK1475490.1 hypothetical protein [Streptomyces sp. 549]
MGTRAVIRFATWKLAPDAEPDAEPVSFAMECAVCGERSQATQEFADAQSWTFRHAGAHPEHHTYREVVTRPWRAWMP